MKAAVHFIAKSSEAGTHVASFHYGLLFQRIQHLSVIAPSKLNEANELCMSDCSAELYLGYLTVSKIDPTKEGAQQSLPVKRGKQAYTECHVAAACPGTYRPNTLCQPVLHH